MTNMMAMSMAAPCSPTQALRRARYRLFSVFQIRESFIIPSPITYQAVAFMASNMENIGIYRPSTIKPTTTPSTRIMSGSSSEVSCLAMDCASSS